MAVQKLANSNVLEPLREQSNVGTRVSGSFSESLVDIDWIGDLALRPRRELGELDRHLEPALGGLEAVEEQAALGDALAGGARLELRACGEEARHARAHELRQREHGSLEKKARSVQTAVIKAQASCGGWVDRLGAAIQEQNRLLSDNLRAGSDRPAG